MTYATVGDVEAEWTENRVYQALRAAASVNGGGDDKESERIYAVLRRLLVHTPASTPWASVAVSQR